MGQIANFKGSTCNLRKSYGGNCNFIKDIGANLHFKFFYRGHFDNKKMGITCKFWKKIKKEGIWNS